jgi:hypothetical protein
MKDYIYCGTEPPVGAANTQKLLFGSFNAIWCPRRRMAVEPKPGERLWLVWRKIDGAVPLLLGGGRLLTSDHGGIFWTNASLRGVRPAAVDLGYRGPTNMAFLHLTCVVIPAKRSSVNVWAIRPGLNVASYLQVDMLSQVLRIPMPFIDAKDGDVGREELT